MTKLHSMEKLHYWPSAQTIANASIDELMIKAKLGYRAKNLKAIATTLTQNFPRMDELFAMAPEEAKNKLLTLQGIGEYSAELVMPKTGFPLDVWSAKIFSLLIKVKYPKNHEKQYLPSNWQLNNDGVIGEATPLFTS